MSTGIISVDVEARLGKLDSGLREAEAAVGASAQKMGEHGKTFADKFEHHLERGVLKGILGLHAIVGSIDLMTAAIEGAGGDIDAMFKSLGNIPVFGHIITSAHELVDVLTGTKELSKVIAENTEREKKAVEEIAKLRKEQDVHSAKATGDVGGVARIEGGEGDLIRKRRDAGIELSKIEKDLEEAKKSEADIKGPGRSMLPYESKLQQTMESNAEQKTATLENARQTQLQLIANYNKAVERLAQEAAAAQAKQADEAFMAQEESYKKMDDLRRKDAETAADIASKTLENQGRDTEAKLEKNRILTAAKIETEPVESRKKEIADLGEQERVAIIREGNKKILADRESLAKDIEKLDQEENAANNKAIIDKQKLMDDAAEKELELTGKTRDAELLKITNIMNARRLLGNDDPEALDKLEKAEKGIVNKKFDDKAVKAEDDLRKMAAELLGNKKIIRDAEINSKFDALEKESPELKERFEKLREISLLKSGVGNVDSRSFGGQKVEAGRLSYTDTAPKNPQLDAANALLRQIATNTKNNKPVMVMP